MLTITVNNQPTELGAPLPDAIYQADITLATHPLMRIPIPTYQIPIIKNWCKTLITNATCEYITYNNVLNLTSDLKAQYELSNED